MTGPTPNKGFEAAVTQGLGGILQRLSELHSMAGPTSEVGSAIRKSIDLLAKHVQPGASTPASRDNDLKKQLQQNTQNRQQAQQMPPMGGGQMPPGMPPSPPGAQVGVQ